MELPELVPIEYRGDLVALVSTRRVHIVAPWLRTRPTGDPELRFVAYMCLCCAEVLRGRLPGPYTDDLGEAWARHAIDDDLDGAETPETPPNRNGFRPSPRPGRSPNGGSRE